MFTRHLGPAVTDTRRTMSLTAARQIRQALAGLRPDHTVNEPLSRREQGTSGSG